MSQSDIEVSASELGTSRFGIEPSPPEAEFRPPNGQPQYVTAVDFAWVLAKRKAGATAAQFGSLNRVYANSQHRMHGTGLIFAHSVRNRRRFSGVRLRV